MKYFLMSILISGTAYSCWHPEFKEEFKNTVDHHKPVQMWYWYEHAFVSHSLKKERETYLRQQKITKAIESKINAAQEKKQ